MPGMRVGCCPCVSQRGIWPVCHAGDVLWPEVEAKWKPVGLTELESDAQVPAALWCLLTSIGVPGEEGVLQGDPHPASGQAGQRHSRAQVACQFCV